jgi:hypothetical protein
MRRTILAACTAITIAGLTLAAQTPPTPRPTQPQPPAAGASSSDTTTLTLTGCLKAWNTSTMGRTGSAPTDPQSGAPSLASGNPEYVLTDIEDSTRKSGATGGAATATPPMVRPGISHDMYLLKAKDSTVNLAQHLNHKIQVTGNVSADSTLKSPATATPPPSTPEAGAPTPRDTSSAAGRPATLTVSSLTMISATCPTTFD